MIQRQRGGRCTLAVQVRGAKLCFWSFVCAMRTRGPVCGFSFEVASAKTQGARILSVNFSHGKGSLPKKGNALSTSSSRLSHPRDIIESRIYYRIEEESRVQGRCPYERTNSLTQTHAHAHKHRSRSALREAASMKFQRMTAGVSAAASSSHLIADVRLRPTVITVCLGIHERVELRLGRAAKLHLHQPASLEGLPARDNNTTIHRACQRAICTRNAFAMFAAAAETNPGVSGVFS